ncbi:MAG: SMR family transporter [Fermentimonas sp.]|nr:SMR family transporter [Fermentimonas sp.]
MNWIILIIGGILESLFALSLGKMQQSTGRELLWWFIAFLMFVASSMFLLYKSMGGPYPIPTGTAYAVWAGVGAVGTVILGIIVFKEPVTFWRMFFLSTLIISIIGLQITSTAGK